MWHVLVFFAAVFLSGCATFSEKFVPVEKKISSGAYSEALQLIEKDKGPERDQVLYLMNKAMVLRMSGDFAASNAAFEEAKVYIDKLSAISVSEQAGAVTVNDAMRSYVGASYEQVLVHIYKALNYLELNDSDGARVEILQADTKLQTLASTSFKDDGFARYLTGIIFESLREYDDAMISYRQAYETYKDSMAKYGVTVPQSLKADLLRLSKRQGMHDEFDRYKAEFANIEWQDAKKLAQQGEVIVLLHNDLAPVKIENSINTTFDGRLIRIAVPSYKSRNTRVKTMKVKAPGREVSGDTVENIDGIARKTLDDEMPGIILRTAARVVVKDKTAKKLGEQNGALGLVMNIFGFVSERADTRSWLTLPNDIQLARLALEPGTYDIDLDMYDRNGVLVATHSFRNVNVEKGKKIFRSYHWITRG
jgi:hypothetical protein